jgi:hypothetical protein
MKFRRAALSVYLSMSLGCAQIGQIAQLVQPPRFVQAPDRPAELRLLQPGSGGVFGGASVRVWLQVTNPNPFGFTLSTLRTTLRLEDRQAATGDFPLGLPLEARQETIVPIDLSISFADIPALGGVLARAATGAPVAYQLDGTVGIDAGRLGQPTFGPMMLVRDEMRVFR